MGGCLLASERAWEDAHTYNCGIRHSGKYRSEEENRSLEDESAEAGAELRQRAEGLLPFVAHAPHPLVY